VSIRVHPWFCFRLLSALTNGFHRLDGRNIPAVRPETLRGAELPRSHAARGNERNSNIDRN
ncbi:hypothetical protein, partial [Candidatus Thiosymbion oneisti]|uniref:hypothetical protein n=1 Tax=Candidatus Thiosymbion oneisti TaxID=589554 RepID=UPI001C405B26